MRSALPGRGKARLRHSTLTFQMSSEATDLGLLSPYLATEVKFEVFLICWGPETEYVAHCSHRHVFEQFFRNPTSFIAIDHFAPGDVSDGGDVVPFRDVIRNKHCFKIQ